MNCVQLPPYPQKNVNKLHLRKQEIVEMYSYTHYCILLTIQLGSTIKPRVASLKVTNSKKRKLNAFFELKAETFFLLRFLLLLLLVLMAFSIHIFFTLPPPSGVLFPSWRPSWQHSADQKLLNVFPPAWTFYTASKLFFLSPSTIPRFLNPSTISLLFSLHCLHIKSMLCYFRIVTKLT